MKDAMKKKSDTGAFQAPNVFFSLIVSAMVLLLSALPDARAIAPSNKFQVIRSALVVKGDFSAARNAAVAESLAAAVDTAVMALLPRDTLIKQFKTVSKAFSGKADQFIQEYKVLTESVVGSEYRVFIEAVVRTDKIQEHLFNAGIMEARQKLPKVLLLIAESPRSGSDPVFRPPDATNTLPPSTEAGIYEAMIEKGHSIIRPAIDAPQLLKTFPASETAFSDTDALELGKRLEAEVVVLGKSLVRPKSQIPSGSGSSPGDLSIRALRTDTGEEIAVVSQRFHIPDSDDDKAFADALFSAGRLGAADLSDRIAQKWSRKTEAIASISLQMRGTDRLENFVTFRRALVELPGVKNMRIEEIQTNEAKIRVDFQGPSSTLANTLARSVFEAFEVLILETAPDRILLALSHRKPDTDTAPAETQ